MFTLNCRGRLLVAARPLVMGIINATPDSFFSGSRQQTTDAILKKAGDMLKDGADILDIGGQSTRPGSAAVSPEEELKRVIYGIEAITKNFPQSFLSIDTYHSLVAKEAMDAGACIVNDISAGSMDEMLIPLVAAYKVPYVLMHMQGRPETMQEAPVYANVTTEVLDFLIQKTSQLREAGIHDIIIDPGFGFGKTISHNFQLLRQLDAFTVLNRPILLGISRKSTIYKTLGTSAQEALNGTTVLNTVGLLNGAGILRVHDVKEAKEAVMLLQQMKKWPEITA